MKIVIVNRKNPILFALIFCEIFSAGTSYSLQLKFIGDANIATGTLFQGTEIGGLSGITYDSKNDEFLCISDARVGSRFYRFKAAITDTSLSMTPVGVTSLSSVDGTPFATNFLDTEGIALLGNGNIFISSEGDGFDIPRVPPSVMEFNSAGGLLRFLQTPDVFLPNISGQQTQGTLPNRGFESLSLTPDENYLFTGSEGALMQDDSPADFTKGTYSRLLRFDLKANTSTEYVYLVDLMPKPAGQNFSKVVDGLSDMVALDENNFLTLERSGALVDGKFAIKIRIYSGTLEGATDVSSFQSIQGRNFNPIAKKLVLDLDDIVSMLSAQFPGLDNLEGMTLGPTLNGHRTLLVVADNNFSASERTLFIAFELIE